MLLDTASEGSRSEEHVDRYHQRSEENPRTKKLPAVNPPVAPKQDQDRRRTQPINRVRHHNVRVVSEHSVCHPGQIDPEQQLPGEWRDTGYRTGSQDADELRQGDQGARYGANPAENVDEHNQKPSAA